MTQPMTVSSLPLVPPTPSAPRAEIALTLLGPSAAMAQLWAQIRRLAPYVRTVLLTGEPDCGQEAVARLLLDLSPQNRRIFVSLSAEEAEARLVRSSGLNSLPSEIFLFLADVHRLSHAAQEALLRLIRMRRARPFTLVAACAEDLRSVVASGRFNAELADVLTSVRIAVPALRQRSEDLPMLITHLLRSRSEAVDCAMPHPSESFLRAAMEHRWPGNLRELTRAMHSLCRGDIIESLGTSDFQRALANGAVALLPPTAPVRLVTLDLVMQEHLYAVLRACKGNKVRAAEVLGISRSTLYRMLDAAAPEAGSSLRIAS